MDLIVVPFPNGLRLMYCADRDNYVITDSETETIRKNIVFLGTNDSTENYKVIPREN